jgi:hypothetical protein
MGSGETSPTMVKVHRSILERLGPPPVPVVLLDTPFGFQENAPELAARVAAYFRESLQTAIEVASTRSSADGDRSNWDAFGEEQLVSRLRAARYVFSGPGSPTYALEQWRDSVVPQLLLEKLENGGAVTFASAAALTLGIATVPVYEIYKVGQPPHWVEGLGLLSRFGIEAAVIPHFNNAEGGTHDTRFCYLGERRLALMERGLPPDAFVLGVDEHTSLSLDLATGIASVAGLGVVTVRGRAGAHLYESGIALPIGELVATGRSLARGARASAAEAVEASPAAAASSPAAIDSARPGAPESVNPLLGIVLDKEHEFAKAIIDRDVAIVVGVLLDMEKTLIDWANDIPGDDSLDRARASFRSMLVELGHLAATGTTDRSEIVGPFVDAILRLRAAARAAGRFDESDQMRDTLASLGVEVRDTAGGAEWSLREQGGADDM